MTQKSIAEDIVNIIKIWESYNQRDDVLWEDDLWELFQHDFKKYIEDDFRLKYNNNM